MNKHLHRTIKLSENNPDPLLFCLSGDTFLISRQYQLAISNYYKVFLLFPENALINLSLGISFIQYAMIRTCKNRHANIVKGFTFLYRYFDISEKSVEAHYNLARAFHFIGCLHLAVPLYEKVIANENADLKNEAAFNLSLIYYSIGNGIMAKNAINNIIV